ncbi:OmpA family protein [Fulvivirga lutimaris]|uniref:OmpA family protein n=1 Tax=Fulvivirga lutimaris TaxID=1819566 RepID=UPI0012BCF436|nr:OmpA family protein [Fulvivirga lutimaris]MTI39668.1 hypothetical protein [Fulvivirga lutimaris]
MKIRVVLFLLASLVTTSVLSQDEEAVVVNAIIIDANTKEPVSSKIKYESLPYGSKIGVFSGDNFTFNMEGGNDYMIVVNSDGYSAYTETIKVTDATNGTIEKIIELKQNGLNRLIRLEKLIFALGKADISPESHEELDEIVNMMSTNESMSIQLEGHTDFRGNAKQNLKLSERRVEAVKNYLVSKGIDKRRIKTKAFGGTQPLSRANDNESRMNNRRVEVRILTN